MVSDMPRERKVSDDKIIQAIKSHPEPVVSAEDVGNAVDLSRQAANERLRMLHNEGVTEKKKVGSGQVWWVKNRCRS